MEVEAVTAATELPRDGRSAPPRRTSRDTTSRSGSCRSSETTRRLPGALRVGRPRRGSRRRGGAAHSTDEPRPRATARRPGRRRARRRDRRRPPGRRRRVPEVDAFSTAWSANRAVTVTTRFEQRIYAIRAVEAPRGVEGELRLAGPANRELALAWMRAFSEEVLHEGDGDAERLERSVDARLEGSETRGIALWEREGRPVSLAGYRPDAQRHPHRSCLHPAGAPRPWLRQRGHSRGVAAPARSRPAALLPLHGPREPDLERHLHAHRLRAGLRLARARLLAGCRRLTARLAGEMVARWTTPRATPSSPCVSASTCRRARSSSSSASRSTRRSSGAVAEAGWRAGAGDVVCFYVDDHIRAPARAPRADALLDRTPPGSRPPRLGIEGGRARRHARRRRSGAVLGRRSVPRRPGRAAR